MKIAKPLLLTITPIGVGLGLYEAHGFGRGILLLMAALLGFIAVAGFFILRTIRRERAEEIRQRNGADAEG